MEFRRPFLVAILIAVPCICGTALAVCPSADLTGDCWVDIADVAVFADQWQAGADANGCPSADLTGDCWVDFADFAVVAGQWLTGVMPPGYGGVTVIDDVNCADAYAHGTFVSASSYWYGTVELDTDPNYLSAPAVKFTAHPYPYSSSLTLYARTPMPFLEDLSNVTDIYYRFYIHPGTEGTITDWRGVKSVAIYLEDYTLTWGNRRRIYYPIITLPDSNQVSTFTPGGPIEPSDVFTLTINRWDGPNDVISVAGADSPGEVVSLLKAAWQTSPLASTVTASGTNTLILTTNAPTGGFSVIPSTKEGNGSQSDGQTFTVSTVYPRNVDYSPGWYEGYLNISGFSYDSAVDMTGLMRYSIVIGRQGAGRYSSKDMTPVITFDRIKFLKNSRKAELMWRFDDGKSIYADWCSYLEQKGMRATIAVITDKVGQTPVYLTLPQLHVLRDAGHCLSNHSTRYHDAHSWSPTYFADTDLFVAQYGNAAQWMNDNGLGRGARIFTLPGGKWHMDWDAPFSSIVDLIWAIDERWSGEDDRVFSALSTRYLGGTFADGSNATEAHMKSLIDKAIANHGRVAFYLHGDPADTAKVKAVADYAKTKIDQGVLECITPYDITDPWR